MAGHAIVPSPSWASFFLRTVMFLFLSGMTCTNDLDALAFPVSNSSDVMQCLISSPSHGERWESKRW